MIDKNSSMPIYLQIETLLTEKISQGHLKSGDFLPSEIALSEQLGTSRMTVRRAVDYLVRQGLVTRIKGKGTLVCEAKKELNISLPLDKHLTFSELLKSNYSSVQNYSLMLKKETATKEIAEALQLPAGAKVWYMERLRLINDIPFVFECSYMVESLFPDLTNAHLDNSKYSYIKKKGFNIESSKKQVKGIIAPADVLQYLKISRDEPVLYAKNISYLEGGVPFEVSDVYYNQAYYNFTIHATRE